MSKNLYSVLLDDEVVRALDRMALARGMSRSALCNLALAEFAGVLTQRHRGVSRRQPAGHVAEVEPRIQIQAHHPL